MSLHTIEPSSMEVLILSFFVASVQTEDTTFSRNTTAVLRKDCGTRTVSLSTTKIGKTYCLALKLDIIDVVLLLRQHALQLYLVTTVTFDHKTEREFRMRKVPFLQKRCLFGYRSAIRIQILSSPQKIVSSGATGDPPHTLLFF